MGRLIALLYGLASYAVFLVTLLYAIGIISGFVGYLLFAAGTTTYFVAGILLEERDLVDLYCDEYRRYKDRVSMLVPWRSRRHQ
jgi:methanethiol S-methyltransferase